MIPSRKSILLVLLIGAVPLAGALISQYAFGYAPCKLCLLQRYPYVVVMLCAVGIALCAKYARIPFYVAIIACMLSAGLGLFHTGVEEGWWKFESSCTTKAGAADSLESLRNAINDSPIVACDQAMLEVLGLSMASWNIIYGLGAAWILLYIARRKPS